MASQDRPDQCASKATERRQFLRSVGTIGAVGVAGCSPNRKPEVIATHGRESIRPSKDAPDVHISYNPYEGVDWNTVTHHKCEFHNHVRGAMDEPADVVDLYHELDYTVYAIADEGDSPMKWPWTAFSDIDASFEDRSPEELGVIAFPGCEFNGSEHVSSIFSTLTHDDIDTDEIDERWEQSHRIVDRTDQYVPDDIGGLAVLAHPTLYYGDPTTGWERYRPDFESRTRERGMVGIEAFNRAAIFDQDIHLWDTLLTAFAPDRMIWGFGVDDPVDYVRGFDIDVNWTTVLLDEPEFDPSDQAGSRRAAARAMTDGRLLLHKRTPWIPERTEPAPVPRVRSITVDRTGGSITIEASDYDTLEWVSSGDVVSTDETVILSSDHTPYIRAHLSNDDGGETSSQPFGLAVS